MEIIPAVLTDDPADLERKIRQVEVFLGKAQIDFMDERFVPTKSISVNDLRHVKTTLDLNAHLMVKRPDQYIDPLATVPVTEITFHIEAVDNPIALTQKIKEAGFGVTIAVNPETGLDDVYPSLEGVFSVLFLTVNPGRQGSPFISEVLEKVVEFNRSRPDIAVAIDGGVNEHNIIEISRAPIDTVYVGSGIFRGDAQANFNKLKHLVGR